MKRLLLLFFLVITLGLQAQQTYEVDGTSYTLKTEIEGKLTLLWNIIDGEYRYFSKKNGEIVELKNTRVDGKYQEEYKGTLQLLTAGNTVSTNKLKLTLSELRDYHDTYNAQVDANYVSVQNKVALSTRLAVFAGMSNYAYFVNPQNTLLPQAGIDFELIDEVKLKRHSVVLQLRQLFANSTYDVSSTQLSLNYRFKFVTAPWADIFINTKISDYVHIKSNIPDPNNDGDMEDAFTGSGGQFQAPFALGLGADIPLANGYITVALYDLIALNLEDNGEFPVDFILGYKFNL